MSRGADVVDAHAVAAWARAAVRSLGVAREALDRVNVFPVPDADTGTNMYLTLLDAVRALPDPVPVGTGAGDLLVRVARGALVGARGNSGVILSEHLRGLAGDLAGQAEVDPPALAGALRRAARTARGAVARPAPGTILTAADAAARSAALAVGRGEPSVATVAAAARDGARAAALRSTGELDVLARAQVLDAGALGLVLVLDALVSVLAPQPGPADVDAPEAPGSAVSEVLGMMSGMVPVVGSRGTGTGPHAAHEGGEFEVMYVVDGSSHAGTSSHGGAQGADPVGDPAEGLRARLATVGDSVVVVGGADAAGPTGAGLWQAHVHTDDPMAAVAVGRAATARGPAAIPDAAGGALRQIRVRHLPGRDEHAPLPGVAPSPGRAPRDVDRTGPGLVAVTSAPALVADLARAGAVVLLRDADGAPDLAAMRRVVVDTRAAHVALLPGAPLEDDALRDLRAAVRDDGVVRLDVLPAPTDLHVAVALAAAQLVEPDGARRLAAARAALAGIRVARADGAAGTGALGELLARARAVEVVTVLADDDVPDDALAELAAVAGRAGVEAVVLRSGRAGTAVTLAVEAPGPAADPAEEDEA